jgi:hypothetical protein
MGLFDVFMSEDKLISKKQRTLTSLDSTPEDREMMAFWFSDKGTPKALMALLSRFDMNLTHQLHDRQEKEKVYSLLASHGDVVERPLRAWLRQCKQFALPLRLFEDMFDKEEAIEIVFELLRVEHEKDDFRAKKKNELLIWLAGVRHGGCLECAALFLTDFDEGVRLAATEVILAQQDDAGREPLLCILKNPDEESNRLKIKVTQSFVARGWKVDEGELPGLAEGYKTQNGQIRAL